MPYTVKDLEYTEHHQKRHFKDINQQEKREYHQLAFSFDNDIKKGGFRLSTNKN